MKEYIAGMLSATAAAVIWSSHPYYAWIPLMLYLGGIAALTGWFTPRFSLRFVLLQLGVGAFVGSRQVGAWLDRTASPPLDQSLPLSFDAQFYLMSVVVAAVCSLTVMLAGRALRRKVH